MRVWHRPADHARIVAAMAASSAQTNDELLRAIDRTATAGRPDRTHVERRISSPQSVAVPYPTGR
jgi:hypothetical protein